MTHLPPRPIRQFDDAYEQEQREALEAFYRNNPDLRLRSKGIWSALGLLAVSAWLLWLLFSPKAHAFVARFFL